MCPDRIIVGFTAPGLLAELVAVPAAYAWPVPDDWSDADAACAEPLTVALTAIKRSGTQPGDRCLVVGAGSQGALVCLALVARGITPYVLEPHAGRRQLAVELGALEAQPGDARFRTVFETSGAAAALIDATKRAARGGTVVLIGLGADATIDTSLLVRRQLMLRGTIIYDHPADFAAAVTSAISSPGQVLRACYPLGEAEAAMRAARDAPARPGSRWTSDISGPGPAAPRAAVNSDGFAERDPGAKARRGSTSWLRRSGNFRERPPQRPAEVRSLAADLGVRIVLYQPFRDYEGVTDEQLAASLRRAEHKFTVMTALGADTLLVCSNVSSSARDDDDLAADQLRRLAEQASGHGIRIAFEALAWGRNISSYARAWQVVAAADHPYLGICLDSFHILSLRDDPGPCSSARLLSLGRLLILGLGDGWPTSGPWARSNAPDRRC